MFVVTIGELKRIQIQLGKIEAKNKAKNTLNCYELLIWKINLLFV